MRRILSLAVALALAAGCAKPPPTFEDVRPAEELYAEGLETLEGRSVLGLFRIVDYTRAIEVFQAIIDNYPYSDHAVQAELQIADAYFADHKYEEALSYYRDFTDLHPQHEQVPYALFQSAQSHERRVRSLDRDQTATNDALLYLDQLLARYPHSAFAEEAERMWRELRTRLARHVMGIADFYRERGEYEAAAERYRQLLTEYTGLGLDAQALYNLGRCYSATERDDEAQRIFQAIVQNYDDSEVADDAESRLGIGN